MYQQISEITYNVSSKRRPRLQFNNGLFRMASKCWIDTIYAMAEGPRDALVSIEKSLQSTNNLDIHPTSVAATKWPYGISLPVGSIICMNLRLAVLIQYR